MVKVAAMVVPHTKVLARLTWNGAALEPVPPLPAIVPKFWVALKRETPAVEVLSVPETGPPVGVQLSLRMVMVKSLQELADNGPATLWVENPNGVVAPALGTKAKRTSGLPKRLSPQVT